MLKNIYQLWIALAILLFSVGVQAQTNKHTLWKIEKAGQPTSYLLGTIHIGDEKSQLTSKTKQALNSSKKIIFESPIPDANQVELLSKLTNEIFNLQDNQNLQKQLGNKRYLAVKALFNGDGFSQYRLLMNYMHDWTLFSILLYPNDGKFSIEYGIESLLLKQVTTQELSHFEDILFAPKLMQAIPKKELHIMIDSQMNNYQINKILYTNMVQLYQSNQIAKLSTLIFNKELGLRDVPAPNRVFWEKWIYQDLLVTRTKSWLPQALAELPKQSTLIAVGLAHLIGEEGLVQLLRNKGYTVTPII